jgi:hypothetical protein
LRGFLVNRGLPSGGTGYRAWRQGFARTPILAVILVVSGIFALFRKQILWGIVLIVVGLLVGPGGVSIFT